MIVFADTSAIGSAYLGDESDGRWISDVIFEGPDPVVILGRSTVTPLFLVEQVATGGPRVTQ